MARLQGKPGTAGARAALAVALPRDGRDPSRWRPGPVAGGARRLPLAVLTLVGAIRL